MNTPEKILLSLFLAGQRRLDLVKARFPGVDAGAIEAAYHAGWAFYVESLLDIEHVSGAITPEQFAAVEREFLQQRQRGLN